MSKRNDNVSFKYLCIKKEYFNPSMIYLNYISIIDRKCIEVIYRSPSIYLDGLFFKTPNIKPNQITIMRKDKQPNNITIKIKLDNVEFINIIKSIDDYIKNYIYRYSKDINRVINKSNDNTNCIEMYKYDNILKIFNNSCEIHLKSYLDSKIINELQLYNKPIKQTYIHPNANKNNIDVDVLNNRNYIFTFNISNIYITSNSLIPLVKCNRCELTDS